MRKQQRRMPMHGSSRRRRLSPLVLVGSSVPVILILIATTVFALPRLASHADGVQPNKVAAAAAAGAINMNCTLIVPANPLSAQGLATPYQLVATNPANGPCNEANTMQAAFVQGAVIDPATGAISIYNPLVITKGTLPAIQPVVPQLPANATVALWFGFNGMNLTLQGTNGSLRQGMCVNGANGTVFGEFAYCNAPAFFNVANQAIAAGQLMPPPLGMGNDGLPCPTVRDFSVVDMDQSDNVTTTYLVTTNGQTAQATAANAAALQNTMVQVNASDNRLLAVAIDGALGCTPSMAPDLADPGQMATALPLDELQAAAQQAAPVAQVPARDPMVLINAKPNLTKLNAYRVGVDQTPAQTLANASTKTYCQNLLNVAPARLQLDSPLTKMSPSPVPAMANSLFTFLAQRFVTTFGANGLNCTGLLKKPSPVLVTMNGNIAINAIIVTPNNNNQQMNPNQQQNNNQQMTL